MKKLLYLLITTALLTFTGCATLEDVAEKYPSDYIVITTLPFDSEIDPNVIFNEWVQEGPAMPGYLDTRDVSANFFFYINPKSNEGAALVFSPDRVLLRYGYFKERENVTNADPIYDLDKGKQRYIRWYMKEDKSHGI